MPAQIPETLANIFAHIDSNQEKYVETLREAVAIKSVSAWPEARPEIKKMVDWTQKKLEALGATCELKDVGMQTLPNGSQIPLPPVLFGQLGTDPKKKTLCVYGHLDVQPALKEDGWDTEPFELIEKDGKLYGRGSTDDKGPVIGWVHAIEAFQKTGATLPINIKFVLEGMEESGSEGLEELLVAEKDKFLAGTDFVCISDNYWLGKKKPCLTYGLRGICYFFCEIECCSKDLHSGVFGGTVHEAMVDLMYMMSQLVDAKGKILIPGIMDQVAPVTPEEEGLYKDIDFDVEDYRNDIGAARLVDHKDKMKTLMARWRFPSLSIHGVEGAFSEPGAKTVIPRRVVGKFSIRIVPDQTPEHVTKCVVDYMEQLWAKRGSPNTMKTSMYHGGKCWVSDQDHPNYEAGRRATEAVYKTTPDMTREGGSIPITLVLQEVTGKNVLLLPMGACDDGAHSQNEKINRTNYIEGTKLLAAYLHEVGQL
ncbi:cytosolic non-specific dipeptidase isoform X2 [Hyalella azteca]|uniref:Cytosolic non-specific dipeptidase isoform X2 n=1 Tax=Hyalella azteca TaxID=294128 RepID=A0A8B7NTY3_HYAAZ|nr:cytosolic non-specific dipeptidase isoform X2 [Hyalella azteca]